MLPGATVTLRAAARPAAGALPMPAASPRPVARGAIWRVRTAAVVLESPTAAAADDDDDDGLMADERARLNCT